MKTNDTCGIESIRNRYDAIFLYILAIQLVTVIAIFSMGQSMFNKIYPLLDYLCYSNGYTQGWQQQEEEATSSEEDEEPGASAEEEEPKKDD